ncbi:MAG: YncE family protein [Myxococcales bacterium]|nr:YncE family protein [Myxococcales bacterium]
MSRVGWLLAAFAASLAPPAAAERLAVVEKFDDRVAIVDVPSGEVVARFPVGHGPHEVVATRDGARLFVSDYGNLRTDLGRSLHVVEVASGTVRALRAPPFVNPHGLALSPDGRRLLATFQWPGPEAVLEFDAASGALRSVHGTGQKLTHMVAFTPDGARVLATAIAAGTLSIVEPGTGRIRSVATGAGAADVAVTPDGRFAWVPNEDADSVSVVDLAAARVVATLPAGGRRPVRVEITPDGGEAWVTLFGDSKVAVFDARAPALRETLTLPDAPGDGAIGLTLSPDGRRAYVAQMHTDRVHVIDTATRRIEATLALGRGPDGLAWLP